MQYFGVFFIDLDILLQEKKGMHFIYRLVIQKKTKEGPGRNMCSNYKFYKDKIKGEKKCENLKKYFLLE